MPSLLRRRLRSDDRGASALASFMVATGLFSLSFATVLLFVAQVGGSSEDTAADLGRQNEALGVASLLTTSPGTPSSWTSTVPMRLGLLKAGTEATVDMGKLSSLGSWQTPTQYDDARTSLGILDRDLFVRSYPVYTRTPTTTLPPGMETYRVAYVGDYAGAAETAASTAESSTLDALAIDFVNAQVDRQGLGLAGDEFPDTANHMTRHLAPRLAGFESAVDMDTLQTGDSYWKVISVSDYAPNAGLDARFGHILTASNSDGTTLSYQAFTNNALIAEDSITLGTFDLRGYGGSDTVDLKFSHYAQGIRTLAVINPATDDYGYVSVVCVESCRTGDDLPATVGGHHFQAGTKANFADATISLSHYVGEKIRVSLVWHSVLSLTAGEGWFLGPMRIDATQGSATKTLWANDLDYTTTRYDALVVGSSVDQSALDDSEKVFKEGLRDWIAAGGHVVALGSSSMTNGWLSPTFAQGSAARTTGSPLLSVSDLSHPILNVPYPIRPGDLTAADRAYRTTSAMRDVVFIGEQGGGTVPLLSVSKPSPSYEGVVLLTSYQPFTLSSAERTNFFADFLLYAQYNPLYVDFGAPSGVPYAGAVSAETRTVLVDATSEGLGTMECIVAAYVW